MKKTQALRDLLGFSQTELALVLNVSRSQFSKFEIGTRDIPKNAKYLLAEMLSHIQSPDIPLKRTAVVQEQMVQLQLQLQCMLKENEYQLLHTARKIEASEKIYSTKVRVRHLVDFLSSRTDSNEISKAAALRAIRHTADKSLQEHGLTSITKLKIKLEVLQLEKIFLDAELRKLLLDTDFIGNKDLF
ncbi:helix-turn-helix transcriptional regulator [Flavobacterium sp.]|uniref:helix-turn-helix domain-containing protein n=1 Tax=Flavobacterium sp. TaxID=239 RepID=UPI0025FEC54B|nr:helix-turn-helix transcriptional regulator [Flavobacterium sp.]